MPGVPDWTMCSSMRGRCIMRSADRVEPEEESVCEGVEPAQASSTASAGSARRIFMARNPCLAREQSQAAELARRPRANASARRVLHRDALPDLQLARAAAGQVVESLEPVDRRGELRCDGPQRVARLDDVS